MRYFFPAILIIFLAASMKAQTACPPEYVCLTAEQARKYLTLADESKAKDAEIAAKNQALKDFEKLVNDLKLEVAKISAEKTASEQMNVRLTAIIDFMLKNGRVKKIGLINF